MGAGHIVYQKGSFMRFKDNQSKAFEYEVSPKLSNGYLFLT